VTGHNSNNDKLFEDTRVVSMTQKDMILNEPNYWQRIGAYREVDQSENFDTVMQELSSAFASVISNILDGTDDAWSSRTLTDGYYSTARIPKTIIFNTTDTMAVKYIYIDRDNLAYDNINYLVGTDQINVPILNFGKDYEEYIEGYWTAGDTSILYRYKPLVVDISDIPDYTP
jgi:hypothetical protein